MKGSKKEQDPVKKKAANKLLREVMGEQCCILILAIPLSFLGSLQDLATSHYIGRALDALASEDQDEFNANFREWLIILVIGALFSGIKDFVYGVSSEKIGMSVRDRFYESIIRKDIGFYDDRKVGDIRKYQDVKLPNLVWLYNILK